MPALEPGLATVVVPRGAFLVCLANGERELFLAIRREASTVCSALLESTEGYIYSRPKVALTVFWNTSVNGVPVVTVCVEIAELQRRPWALTAALQNAVVRVIRGAFCKYWETFLETEWAENVVTDLVWGARSADVCFHPRDVYCEDQ